MSSPSITKPTLFMDKKVDFLIPTQTRTSFLTIINSDLSSIHPETALSGLLFPSFLHQSLSLPWSCLSRDLFFDLVCPRLLLYISINSKKRIACFCLDLRKRKRSFLMMHVVVETRPWRDRISGSRCSIILLINSVAGYFPLHLFLLSLSRISCNELCAGFR